MNVTIGLLFWAALLNESADAGSSRVLREEPAHFRNSTIDSIPYVYVAADAVRQVYAITAKGTIEKFAPDGRKMAQYSRTRLGAPAFIDPSNPMKSLVWYPDYQAILFLDRNLTETGGELQLNLAGWPEVRVVAQASDGNIWLYDEAHFKLRKITPEGKAIMESRDFNLLFSQTISVQCIRDDGNHVYVSSPVVGVLVFDVFGQFERVISAQGIADFILYQSDGATKIRYITPEGKAAQISAQPPYENEFLPIPANAWFTLTPGGWVSYSDKTLIFHPYP